MSNLEIDNLPTEWKNLFKIKKQINSIGGQDTFNEMMYDRVEKQDLEELYENFKKEFKNYPLNHPLYLEAQKIMIDLGFTFYVDEEEKKENTVELLPKELVDEVYKNIDPENPVRIMTHEEIQDELTTTIKNLELKEE
jgi:hypothetical protein